MTSPCTDVWKLKKLPGEPSDKSKINDQRNSILHKKSWGNKHCRSETWFRTATCCHTFTFFRISAWFLVCTCFRISTIFRISTWFRLSTWRHTFAHPSARQRAKTLQSAVSDYMICLFPCGRFHAWRWIFCDAWLLQKEMTRFLDARCSTITAITTENDHSGPVHVSYHNPSIITGLNHC